MEHEDSRLLMIIDRDCNQAQSVAKQASREGWRTVCVEDAESAIATLGTQEGMQLSAIVLDQSVPGDDVCELIAEMKTRRPALPIMMLTANTSPLLAVEAMRAGASDYLVKPVAPEKVMQAVNGATRRGSPQNELAPLTEKIKARGDFDSMIGAAPAFRNALAVAAKAARGHGYVLIEGENGTGKEMLVRAMQAASPRAKGPFKLIDVADLSASAIDSALFGHEKGAFAGAFDNQTGALQNCDGGTLALDSIDRLPLATQERLAEVIESKTVRPLGATYGFRIDTRILACCDSKLEGLVEAGLFSEALYGQLSATRIDVPPLRERATDIAALSRHFLAQIAEQPGLRQLGITDGAIALLAAFDWPGNVRQLQAVLFRAAVFTEGDALTSEDFPQLSSMVVPDRGSSGSRQSESAGVMLYAEDGNLRPLEEIEADVIRLAIGHYRGRMTEVARRLGIGRSTLYRKLSDLGIDNAA
ncbi:sigma-54-dependent transcriptional regulator [Pseudoblastomonas halimionae]|uniref:DNA-binding transcriptional regulator NtrC n=1 Tax=Alteriqipengyuania halimionae TaxID=1926630 RepID=A0A6I4U262_9SPHN|nr:sigma-54 dependent transcriptional regulator [Alteriqipengyuania halimionae]MXP09025.1 response regulator [Alteriqipengyuania halimionae]